MNRRQFLTVTAGAAVAAAVGASVLSVAGDFDTGVLRYRNTERRTGALAWYDAMERFGLFDVSSHEDYDRDCLWCRVRTVEGLSEFALAKQDIEDLSSELELAALLRLRHLALVGPST